jgi:hypothetical protein
MTEPSDWQEVDLTWNSVHAYAEAWVTDMIAAEPDPLGPAVMVANRKLLVDRTESELRKGLMDIRPAEGHS